MVEVCPNFAPPAIADLFEYRYAFRVGNNCIGDQIYGLYTKSVKNSPLQLGDLIDIIQGWLFSLSRSLPILFGIYSN